MSNTECPICKSQATVYPRTFDGEKLNCSRCGDFSIVGTASASWSAREPSSRQITNASSWIREHQGIIIDSSQIDFLLSIKLPSVAERATKILVEINKLSTDLSYKFDLDSKNANYWLGISYSDNYGELYYLFKTYLKDELGFLSFTESNIRDPKAPLFHIYITPGGYTHLDSRLNHNVTTEIGFCAMWFDKSVLPIWTEAVLPAIKDSGYDPKRIDSHQHNNRIDDEIIAMLRRSKFVVADFTGQRGGVYFEAGFALGLGLPVIWTCKKSELKEVHFDNRQYNFVTWDEGKLDEFKIALQNRIEATIGRGNFQ